MNQKLCTSCQLQKPVYTCGLCSEPVCKKCVQIMDEDSFAFWQNRPQELRHDFYCTQCFDLEVSSKLDEYQALLQRAGEVLVYYKEQGKETRLIKRTENPLVVSQCADRDKAVLNLAYLAASSHFNAIIDVVLSPQKIRDGGGYQHTVWNATGIPVTIDQHRRKFR